MEAESIESLTPLIRQADQWREVAALLSADNAIALAAISRRLHDRARQEMALNLGLLLALVFRLGLIAAAQWVLHFWPLQLAAAAYLLWLCGRHLQQVWWAPEQPEDASSAATDAAPAHVAAGLAGVVATLALTDLAFSLDSVAAAAASSR